jgi:hypothetical protein
MGWFEDAYPWVPETCANGHPMRAPNGRLSFIACRDCPAQVDGRGHFRASCAVLGCRAPRAVPPDCTGPRDPNPR